MKFTRKKFPNQRNRKSRSKLSIVIILIITIPTLFIVIKKIKFTPFYLNTETKIEKPVSSEDTQRQIINLLQESNIEVERIRRNQDTIEVSLIDGPIVVFDKNDLAKKVTSLQAILERFKIEGRKVKSIDLRFSKPIIK